MGIDPRPEYDMAALRQFVNSEEGRAIIRLLSTKDNAGIQAAISSVSSGNFQNAKSIIERLLSDEEIKTALQQLGGINGR